MAVNVVAVPLQIVEFPEIVSIGNAFTCTVKVSVFVHPLLLVPSTVYVIDEVGLTVIELDVLPVFHK